MYRTLVPECPNCCLDYTICVFTCIENPHTGTILYLILADLLLAPTEPKSRPPLAPPAARLRSSDARVPARASSLAPAPVHNWVATSLSHQYINVYKNKTFIIHQDTRKMWGVTMPAKINTSKSQPCTTCKSKKPG
jgi:hypothetical protein